MCNINYHVVWCVKYRRKIITPQIEKFLKDLAQEIAKEKGFTVHLTGNGPYPLFRWRRQTLHQDTVKYLKGITGRKLFGT